MAQSDPPKPKPYKPKSLAGAARKVRSLQRQNRELGRALAASQHVSRMLARLAATGPAFDNPIIAGVAVEIRNQLLAELGLNPDGSPKDPSCESPGEKRELALVAPA